MSDELFEKDELEDEDVEAHRRLAMANDDDDDSDDVEAHRRQA